ncbi:putative golgin subfamily A member 6-like protein 19 isoform X5 [Tachysurus ichikawai]
MLCFNNLTRLAVWALGAVAVAAGLHFLYNREDKMRRCSKGTPVDGDPVQRASSGFLHFSDGCNYTQLDMATPEAGGKHEKDEVSSVQLNSEEPSEDKECEQERQTFKVLKEMHDDLLKMIKQREEECEQERQAHRLLKENYYRLIKMVKQNKEECEQEQQAHTLLKVKYDEIVKQNEEVLKGTLEHEHGKLKEQVKTLQGSVNRLEGQFYEAQRVCEELLNVSTGITELSAEDDLKFNSMHQAHTQQVPLETLKTELFGTHFETSNEQMRQQDYNVLWFRYEKTLSTLVHENARLKEQVKTLQDSVEKLERKLHECHCTHEENLVVSKESLNYFKVQTQYK